MRAIVRSTALIVPHHTATAKRAQTDHVIVIRLNPFERSLISTPMTFLSRLTLAAPATALIVSFATATAAQTARTPGAVVREPELDIGALLKSRDARQQAWGAWYAGTGQLRQFAPLLQDVVREHMHALISPNAALDVALDALIQLKSPLDAEVLTELYAVRPAQALIAASFSEDRPDFLRDIVRTGTGHDWFAAANLLLARNARTLVPDLLAPLRLKVRVYLVDDGHMMGGGDGSGVGVGCGGIGLAPGMPPWATYVLTSFPHAGVTVLETGPKPMYYRRTVSPAGQGPAGSEVVIGGPTGDERLQYIVAAAGIDPASVPLRGFEQHSVSVKEINSLNAELARIRADLSARYQQFLATLVHSEAVPADAARTYPAQIDLVIEDHRTNRPSSDVSERRDDRATASAPTDLPATADSADRPMLVPEQEPAPRLDGRSPAGSAFGRRGSRWPRRHLAASSLRARRRRRARGRASRSGFPHASRCRWRHRSFALWVRRPPTHLLRA